MGGYDTAGSTKSSKAIDSIGVRCLPRNGNGYEGCCSHQQNHATAIYAVVPDTVGQQPAPPVFPVKIYRVPGPQFPAVWLKIALWEKHILQRVWAEKERAAIYSSPVCRDILFLT